MKDFNDKDLTIDGVQYTKAKYNTRKVWVAEHKLGKSLIAKPKPKNKGVASSLLTKYPQLPMRVLRDLLGGKCSVSVAKDGVATVKENGTGALHTYTA